MTISSCPQERLQDGIRRVRYLLGEASVKEKWNNVGEVGEKPSNHNLNAGLILL